MERRLIYAGTAEGQNIESSASGVVKNAPTVPSPLLKTAKWVFSPERKKKI